MPDVRFEDLMCRLVDDELAAEELDELVGLVRDNPDRQDRLCEQLESAEMLALAEDELRDRSLFIAAVHSRLGDDAFVGRVRSAVRQGGRTASWRSPRRFLPGVIAVCASAVVMVALLLPDHEPAKLPTRPVEMQAIARLISAVDPEWKQSRPTVDGRLMRGAYTLRSGRVELGLDEGARVTLRGPATFELSSANHIHLVSGNLVARIPDEALGFAVTTPQTEVVDLGTEFGLQVDNAGRTDIHVLDGLVQAFPLQANSGVMIAQGEARRIDLKVNSTPQTIPIASRDTLLGGEALDGLGLELLRGWVRVRHGASPVDLRQRPTGRHWIDVIPEKQGMVLPEPVEVTIDSPGVYRRFDIPTQTLPAGTRVNSYLFHFCPTKREQVSGVVRFARPIVGVVCLADELQVTDQLLGLPHVSYPRKSREWRGVEPVGVWHGEPPSEGPLLADEVTLSQDRTTLSLRMMAHLTGAVDQVRVLTLSERDDSSVSRP